MGCIENAPPQLRLLGICRVPLDSRRCTRYRRPVRVTEEPRAELCKPDPRVPFQRKEPEAIGRGDGCPKRLSLAAPPAMLMLESNNLEIAEFLRDRLEGEVRK